MWLLVYIWFETGGTTTNVLSSKRLLLFLIWFLFIVCTSISHRNVHSVHVFVTCLNLWQKLKGSFVYSTNKESIFLWSYTIIGTKPFYPKYPSQYFTSNLRKNTLHLRNGETDWDPEGVSFSRTPSIPSSPWNGNPHKPEGSSRHESPSQEDYSSVRTQ